MFEKLRATAQAVATHAQKHGVRKTVNVLRMSNGLRKSGIVLPAGTRLAGTDRLGNKYYECLNEDIFMDRWVVYANSDIHMSSPTQVPPEWHSWLHRMTDTTPVEAPRSAPEFQKEPITEPMPSEFAIGSTYVPPGHALRGNKRVKYSQYEAWAHAEK